VRRRPPRSVGRCGRGGCGPQKAGRNGSQIALLRHVPRMYPPANRLLIEGGSIWPIRIRRARLRSGAMWGSSLCCSLPWARSSGGLALRGPVRHDRGGPCCGVLMDHRRSGDHHPGPRSCRARRHVPTFRRNRTLPPLLARLPGELCSRMDHVAWGRHHRPDRGSCRADLCLDLCAVADHADCVGGHHRGPKRRRLCRGRGADAGVHGHQPPWGQGVRRGQRRPRVVQDCGPAGHRHRAVCLCSFRRRQPHRSRGLRTHRLPGSSDRDLGWGSVLRHVSASIRPFSSAGKARTPGATFRSP